MSLLQTNTKNDLDRFLDFGFWGCNKQTYLSSPFQPHLGACTADCCRFPSAPAAWSEPADWVRLEPGFSSKPLRCVAWVRAVPFHRGFSVWCGCDTEVRHVGVLQHRELGCVGFWVFVYVWMLSCVCLHLCEHCKLWCLPLNVSSWQINGHERAAASTSCIPNHLVGKHAVGHWFWPSDIWNVQMWWDEGQTQETTLL